MTEILLMLAIPVIFIIAGFSLLIETRTEREKDNNFDNAVKTTLIGFVAPCVAIIITIILMGIIAIIIG